MIPCNATGNQPYTSSKLDFFTIYNTQSLLGRAKNHQTVIPCAISVAGAAWFQTSNPTACQKACKGPARRQPLGKVSKQRLKGGSRL